MGARTHREEVHGMLGDRLGESAGKITTVRILPCLRPSSTTSPAGDINEVEEDGSYRWTMWEWTGGGQTDSQAAAAR
jgi:hypothetical protein